jgi:predicted alpha/beta superfamily hydrolase
VSAPQLRKHDQFPSRFLRNRRDIVVYLPAGYDDQRSRSFPALFMQDGQNLFDGETSFIRGMDWRLGQTADELVLAGKIEPLVIVGIYNTGKSRIREYTPTRARKLGGGGAKCYGKFLIEELMPFIYSSYRIERAPENTGIGGSSLGGLLSLYLGLKMPGIFGRIASLSPSVWWDKRVILRFVAKSKPEPRPRVWLDIGTCEDHRIVEDVENFRDVLLKKGWCLGNDLHYQRVEGAEHNEAAWAQRIGPCLEFLFPAK